MSKGHPIAARPATPAVPGSTDADAPDPSVAMAERQLRMLQEIAERGMRMIRILEERTEIDLQIAKKLAARADLDDGVARSPNYPAPMNDASAMFARYSRAVRLTLALEARTDERLRALRAGLVVERETRREEAASRVEEEALARHEEARDKVSSLVHTVIEAEARDSEDDLNLCKALYERLEDDEAYFELEDRPLREVVEQLCADLDIAPDWSRWTGGGWKVDGASLRPRFSPYNAPSRKPVNPAPA